MLRISALKSQIKNDISVTKRWSTIFINKSSLEGIINSKGKKEAKNPFNITFYPIARQGHNTFLVNSWDNFLQVA